MRLALCFLAEEHAQWPTCRTTTVGGAGEATRIPIEAAVRPVRRADPARRCGDHAGEARDIAARLGGRVVIKSQVLVGGRGKAGGIRLAKDPNEAEQVAGQILGMNIKGLTVKKVLVDEAADIATEIYLGIVIDRGKRRPVMMASSEGGVEIEEVARTKPERIVKIAIDPFLGLQQYQGRELAFGIGLPKDLSRDFCKIAEGLYNAFVGCDASLAEINPLVVTGDGQAAGGGRQDPARRQRPVPPL